MYIQHKNDKCILIICINTFRLCAPSCGEHAVASFTSKRKQDSLVYSKNQFKNACGGDVASSFMHAHEQP